MLDQRLPRLACDPHGKAARHHVFLELADAGPSFDVGYELLERYFGPRGAMDDRESLRRLIADPWQHGNVSCRYDLMLARDESGTVLAAGDCFSAIVDRRVPFAAFPLHHLEQVDPDDPSRYLPPQPSLLTLRALHAPYQIDVLRRDELHMFADTLAAVGSKLVRKASSTDNVARIRRGIDTYPNEEIRLPPLPGESDSLQELSRLLGSCAFTGGSPSKAELRWLAEKLAG